MDKTPKGSQLHIGLFGKRNAGKSTLMNALLDQEMSIVSPIAGTTTDIVHKSIEWHPLGPVVLVDTPGLDDEGELGLLRVQKAKKVLGEVDLVLWVTEGDISQEEQSMLNDLEQKNRPYLVIYNSKEQASKTEFEENKSKNIFSVNAETKWQIGELKAKVADMLKDEKEQKCIGDKVKLGDVVLLVMPQDLQAPKGRLILPQVQILRELLDAKAIPIMTTKETLDQTLEALKSVPNLIITDSQIFEEVYEKKPKDVPLTSFSILLARQKGDLKTYVEGAKAISRLKEGDKVLISESCTHNPLHGDIARQKLPAAITKKVVEGIVFENVAGNNFPDTVRDYKLIIQCGGCMQTPKQIGARIEKARQEEVAITNFGVALAYLAGILDKVWLPL